MEKLIEIFGEEKRNVDRLKMNYLFDEDLKVCDYVSSQLFDFDIATINRGNVISFDELFIKSIDEFKIFGMDICTKIQEMTSKTSIHCKSDNIDQFTTVIGFQEDGVGSVLVNSGIVDRYIIPYSLYEISIYYFAHEHIHALKETNYEEYRDGMTLGETIPIFFEFLIYKPDEILKKELIKIRLNALLSNKLEYEFFDELFMMYCVMDKSLSEKICENENINMCEFLRSKLGNYLNSFYYALMLYSLYKETPNKILSLVNKVLKREITTFQLLNILGLYGDIKGEVFERELGLIRKLVK